MRPFWTDLAEGGDAVALMGAGGALTYAQLAERVGAQAAVYAARPRGLVMLGARLDFAGVVHYLAALAADRPVFLIKPETAEDDLARLLELYRPAVLVLPDGADYRVEARAGDYPIHPDLALLLSTSGSVGAPKAVRLSGANVAANARQIADSLGLQADERAALTMPLYFTYGLSVLNSQLQAGASVWLDPRTAIDPKLWSDLAAAGATSFHGVPMTYQLLQRLNRPVLEGMRRLTQAGGRLPPPSTEWLAELSRRTGAQVWKMYGMTEATARISILPPDQLFERPDSAGRPVEGGALEIGAAGEVVYRGPNVMMGYAHGWEDLSRGDELRGVLVTADAGRIDEAGYLYVLGRMDRTVKLFGLRIELDDVERRLGAGLDLQLAAVCDGERILVFTDAAPALAEPVKALAAKLKIPPHAFQVRAVEALPRTGSGKVDYRRLVDAG